MPCFARSSLFVLLSLSACGARSPLEPADDAPIGHGGEGQGGEGTGTGGDIGGAGGGGAPPVFSLLAAGAYHTCAVREGLACWGGNQDGQLGNGDFVDSSSPIPVSLPMAGDVTLIAAGYRHTCAVVHPHHVYCWGDNGNHQIGTSFDENRVPLPTLVPLPALGDAVVTTLTAGEDHSCAGASDGRTFCWGSDTQGQLGTPAEPGWKDPPGLAALPATAPLDLAAGDFHGCAIVDERTFCWGANFHGQLGNGTEVSSPIPIEVAHLGFSRVASKGFTTFGIDPRDGKAALWGWGDNFGHVLGPVDGEVWSPTLLFEATDLTDVSAGLSHVCTVHRDDQTTTDQVHCWGENSKGQLGDGTAASRSDPRPIALAQRFHDVEAGTQHTCAFTHSGDLYCWGINERGQCGQPATDAVLLPSLVTL